MRIVTDEVTEEEFKCTAHLIELDNAVMVFFDELDSMKLGTLAIAVPQYGGRTGVSSVFIGDRNTLITKILAERLVKIYNKIALVSTHFAEIQDRGIGAILLRLTQSLYEKARRE